MRLLLAVICALVVVPLADGYQIGGERWPGPTISVWVQETTAPRSFRFWPNRPADSIPSSTGREYVVLRSRLWQSGHAPEAQPN